MAAWHPHIGVSLSPKSRNFGGGLSLQIFHLPLFGSVNPLRAHILPQFKGAAVQSMGVHDLQQFATDLRKSVSRKTILNILGTVFTILNYKTVRHSCSLRPVQRAWNQFGDCGQCNCSLLHPATGSASCCPIQTTVQNDFRGRLEHGTACRKILALTRGDLDFQRKTIRVNKSADDKTREIRAPKTKKSVAMLPMPSALETSLSDYIQNYWQENSGGLLFPNHEGTRPASESLWWSMV